MIAAELRAGMVIRLERKAYRILEATHHAGTGKHSGFVHARLLSLRTGSQTERRLRLDEKVDDLFIKEGNLARIESGEYLERVRESKR